MRRKARPVDLEHGHTNVLLLSGRSEEVASRRARGSALRARWLLSLSLVSLSLSLSVLSVSPRDDLRVNASVRKLRAVMTERARERNVLCVLYLWNEIF